MTLSSIAPAMAIPKSDERPIWLKYRPFIQALFQIVVSIRLPRAKSLFFHVEIVRRKFET